MRKATILKVSTLDYFFIEHWGLLVNEDGEDYVYHITNARRNEFGGNILKEKYADFMQDREEFERMEVEVNYEYLLAYVWQNRTRRYNVFIYNCEHLISEVLMGVKQSPQLKEWLVKSFIASSFFAFVGYQIGKKKKRKKSN